MLQSYIILRSPRALLYHCTHASHFSSTIVEQDRLHADGEAERSQGKAGNEVERRGDGVEGRELLVGLDHRLGDLWVSGSACES